MTDIALPTPSAEMSAADACGDGISGFRKRLLFALVVLLAFALYYLTCMPGVGWQDCALLQYRVWRTDLKGECGLALAHPLYIVLAKGMTWLPVGNFAYRVNLFSAACGALALGLCAALLWRLTTSLLAAAVGTIALGVSHTFWLHAVIAEEYDLYVLLLLAELLLVERFVNCRQPRWLILALLANGLNVSVHDLALLHEPAYLGLIVWSWRQHLITMKHVFLGGIALLIGSALYTTLILSAIIGGQPVGDALREALTGKYYAWAVLATKFDVVRQVERSASYFVLNFPTPLILLGPLGAYWSWKNPRLRWFALFAGSIFVIDAIFAFRDLVADAYKFFAPAYAIVALFIGLAVPHLGKSSRSKSCILCLLALLPIAVYEVAPTVLRSAGVSLGISREIPLRDNYSYFLRPRKNGEDSAEQFGRVALNEAAPDGLLIADGDTNIKNVLTYVRDVEGIQPNVVLTRGPDIDGLRPIIVTSPKIIAPFVEQGRAYTCSSNPNYVLNWILERYQLEPVGEPKGIVYRLKPK